MMSSSGVQGPFLMPILSQQGGLPMAAAGRGRGRKDRGLLAFLILLLLCIIVVWCGVVRRGFGIYSDVN